MVRLHGPWCKLALRFMIYISIMCTLEPLDGTSFIICVCALLINTPICIPKKENAYKSMAKKYQQVYYSHIDIKFDYKSLYHVLQAR